MRWSRLLLGDDELGLRLRPLKPGPGARAAAAGAVVGKGGAPRQGVTRDPAAVEDQPQWRRAKEAGPVSGAPLWTPQRGQGVVSPQPPQGRMGQTRALSGARACPARARAWFGVRQRARGTGYGGGGAGVGTRGSA